MFNQHHIIGIVASDKDKMPLRRTADKSAVLNFTVMTWKQWKDQEGNLKTSRVYHKVVVYGKKAEELDKFLYKDSPIQVIGCINHRKWNDNGVEKIVTETKADTVEIVELDFHTLEQASRQPKQASPQPSKTAKDYIREAQELLSDKKSQPPAPDFDPNDDLPPELM